MFEKVFKEELKVIETDQALIDKFWNEINANYTKPGRHYHNLGHLDNLISELYPIKNKINDWQILVFSVAYHDIIYNILKNDNEEKSAEFANERLSILNLTETKKAKCREQILATKSHDISSDSDTSYFTDADLAILGSEYSLYKTYTLQIRKEYKYYPDLLYKPGRKKVLKHFLQMNSIFKTQYFYQKYEQQARKNIERELSELE